MKSESERSLSNRSIASRSNHGVLGVLSDGQVGKLFGERLSHAGTSLLREHSDRHLESKLTKLPVEDDLLPRNNSKGNGTFLQSGKTL
jgi:hypothetical protein